MCHQTLFLVKGLDLGTRLRKEGRFPTLSPLKSERESESEREREREREGEREREQ